MQLSNKYILHVCSNASTYVYYMYQNVGGEASVIFADFRRDGQYGKF